VITAKELQELFIEKQMRLLVEKAERAKDTIIYCDTEVSEAIKNHAISTDDDDTYIDILFTKPNEKDGSFHPVKPDGRFYADGTASMASTEDWLDFDTFVSYCKANGFRLYSTSKDYYQYGNGSRKGIKILICWGDYTCTYWDEL